MDEHFSDLYLSGDHYDRLFNELNWDIPFWLEQANRYGGPILELACGTGRVAIPLAQAGYRVTGIDNAPGMLDQARIKAAAAGVQIEWMQADLRDFNLSKTFPLVIFPANSLGHILYLQDLETFLANVRRCLDPTGRFVLTYFVPKSELLLNQPDERFPFGEYEDPAGGGVVPVTQSYIYEPDTQIKRIKTYYTPPGEETEIVGQLNIRMYYPQELDALLKYNGFQIEHKYGDLDQGEFNAQSGFQLIVCRLAN